MAKLKCFFITFFFSVSSLMTPASLVLAYETEDAFIAGQKKECATNTAMEWNTSLNKCMAKAQALDDRKDAQNCNKLTDVKEREACHLALAEKNTGLSSDTTKLYESKGNASLMINGAYTVVSLINMAGKGGIKSGCTSKKVFGLTAVVGVATDLLLKSQAKKKVESLKEKYKLETEMAANTAQVKALEYLKEEQETVVKIAGMERKRNMLLTAGYGAAAAMALFEIASGKASTPDCSAPSKSAPSTTPAPAVPTAAVPASTASALGNVTGILGNPKGIIVMAAIGAVYSGKLMAAAAQQEKDSKENVKKIDAIIKSFNDSFRNLCPNGREKLEEPQCYCYLEGGAQNTNRSNSQICQELWKKSQYDLDTMAENYNKLGEKVDPIGCVAVNGQFDEKCQCKKFVNAKGVNACMKTSNISLPSGLGASFIQSSGIKELSSVATNLGNGNSILDTLNVSDLSKNAINAKNARDQLLTTLSSSLPKDILPLTKMDEKNVDQFARAALGTSTMDAIARSNPMTATGMASSRSENEKINNLLKEAELKVGIDLSSSGGKGLTSKGAKKEMEFNFTSDNSGGAGAGGQIVQGFQEKTYNYKNSDIVTDENASIFEIISNRYVQSGLRRLFEEEASKKE